MAEIPAEAKHLLGGKNFAHVATLMPDGAPQVSPVWVDEKDGLVVVNTAEGRLKPKTCAATTGWRSRSPIPRTPTRAC